MAKQLISSSSTKSVYRDGNVAIKEFCEGFPKAEVLNEALCNARVEDLPGLHVPKILGVSVVDGKWSIMKEYIEGKTLEQLMEENPDKTQEYMEQMVDLQLEIHSKACPLLNKLKEKTIRALNEEPELDESTRYELLTRLDGMPKHTKLCHGDFSPSNIIVQEDGTMYVIENRHGQALCSGMAAHRGRSSAGKEASRREGTSGEVDQCVPISVNDKKAAESAEPARSAVFFISTSVFAPVFPPS